MENLEDPEVEQWFRTQADYARSVLNAIPGRQSLIDKMREFDTRKSARIYYLKITDNDRYFYLKQTPEDEVGKLFFRDGYEGDEIKLYDPETDHPDTSRNYVISSLTPSHDGSKIAFEVAPDGTESSVIYSMDVETGALFPEQIDRCWGAYPSWLPDNKSFLFNRLQSADLHVPEQIVTRCRIDQNRDPKCFEDINSHSHLVVAERDTIYYI